ncbi:hypothetical protein CAPTEDRAFT_207669 [Capitella teleta]|uniref:Sphingomyelin phosphodiesterase n=1 Tax=Capitella teleta TaxID=283909 RepID=R7UUN9_CAPTE|nr:hypothetical protein CAPTEDRAFT_207669 [Capitella teleta]|eukprot:ELU09883.1 hypothetical protein CAPTEDRAFT_207669 [Capitella teleta]
MNTLGGFVAICLVAFSFSINWEEQISDIDIYADTNGTCAVCLLATRWVNENIDKNLTYADVRNSIIVACVVLLGQQARGDIMCPGLMDHYYPPIEHTLTLKPMDAPTLCVALHFCDQYDVINETSLYESQPRNSLHTEFDKYTQEPSISRARDDLIKVVQMTDVHVDYDYVTGTATDCGLYLCCREGDGYEGNGTAGHWGDMACNTPRRTVDLILRHVSEVIQPDFVLYSGDSPPHAMWEETQEIQLNYTQYLTEIFREGLPDTPVYPTIGNHDMYPTNLYYLALDTIQEVNREFFANWEDLAFLNDANRETVEKGGFFETLAMPGLRILSYNSVLAYAQNFYSLLNEDDPVYEEMKVFMKDTLLDAQSAGEKVIVVGHIPPGVFSLDAFAEWLNDVMVQFKDTIVLHVYGHTHNDHYTLFTDPESGSAESMFFIAPSVTPKTDRNPSIRVYWLDPEDFHVVDYHQLFINISAAGGVETEPPIEFAYSALDEYHLADMTPHSWRDLAERFERDDDLFDVYISRHTTQNGKTDDCDETCRRGFICEIQNLVFPEINKCKRAF